MREALRAGLARLQRRWIGRLVLALVRDRLTPAGRAVLLTWFISAALGATSLSAPIYQFFAFATVSLLIAAIAARFALPPLELRRVGVTHTSAGGELTIDVEVTNRSRRVARDVGVVELALPASIWSARADRQETIGRLAPGATAVIPHRLRCARRGSYTLRALRATSTFPLGLWRALRRSSQETSFLVYPAFRTPDRFPIPEGRNYQPGGILLSSNVGESAEFMHTREYRDGDNPRHVHWPSTARLGRPIVKVYHEEYFVRLALILDTELAPGASDAAIEHAISTAAGIADHLSRQDYIIDLFAAGENVFHFQAGRSLAHFDHILEILACIDGSPTVDWDALAEAIVPEAPRLTGVVAVFLDWTAERSRLVDELRALGVGVRVIVVRDGATSTVPPPMAIEQWVQLAPGEEPPFGRREAVA